VESEQQRLTEHGIAAEVVNAGWAEAQWLMHLQDWASKRDCPCACNQTEQLQLIAKLLVTDPGPVVCRKLGHVVLQSAAEVPGCFADLSQHQEHKAV